MSLSLNVLDMIREDLRDNPNFANWFRDSKVVDSQGNPLRVYHGTRRPDRVGLRFRKSRATSGPMAYFTEDPEIASGYATGKADTSHIAPDSYADWFRYKPEGSRSEVSISKAWYYLKEPERSRIAHNLVHVSNTDEEGESIEGFRIDPNSFGLTSEDTWKWHIQQARGNVLAAAVDLWLNGGVLFGEEGRFLEVLKLAGLDRVRFDDPNRENPALIPVYLSIQNPLDTSNIPEEVISALNKKGGRKKARLSRSSGDLWDKNARSGPEWLANLEDDLEHNTTHVWTSIPDWVTEVLKSMGYDGIKDTGGKMGGDRHVVWIPFEENQIKSAIGNKGRYDPSRPKITESLSVEILKITRSLGEYNQPANNYTNTAGTGIRIGNESPQEEQEPTGEQGYDTIAPRLGDIDRAATIAQYGQLEEFEGNSAYFATTDGASQKIKSDGFVKPGRTGSRVYRSKSSAIEQWTHLSQMFGLGRFAIVRVRSDRVNPDGTFTQPLRVLDIEYYPVST